MLTSVYVKLSILRDSAKERVLEAFRRVRDEKEGAAVVEYALLIAALVMAAAGAAFALYTAVSTRLQNAADVINTGNTF